MGSDDREVTTLAIAQYDDGNREGIEPPHPDAFCHIVANLCNDTPQVIAAKLIEEKVLPADFLAVFKEPVMTLIERIRDNAKAAVGKSNALAQALKEDSQQAVKEFLKTNAPAIAEFGYISANAMRLLTLEATILSAKDLNELPIDALESGMVATLDLREIVAERFIASLAERVAAHLIEQGIQAKANSKEMYSQKIERGTIHVGEKNYQRAEEVTKAFLLHHMPNIEFYVQNAGIIPAKAISIYIAGKKK